VGNPTNNGRGWIQKYTHAKENKKKKGVERGRIEKRKNSGKLQAAPTRLENGPGGPRATDPWVENLFAN